MKMMSASTGRAVLSPSLKTVCAVGVLLAVAAGGAAGLSWSLARGVGLNPDSARYLDCAINLSRGQGYNSALFRYYRPIPVEDYVREIVSEGGVRPRPEIYYLPAYPVCLASLIGAGFSAQTAAGWLAIFLFGLNAATVGFLVYRATRGSVSFAVGAALFMLGSESMLYVHTMALSEPLFIFLCLTGLFFLTEYLEKGGRGFLLAGAVVSGLAFLTRYSAAALIGTSLVGLCLIAKKPTFKKLPAALAFLFLSCLPLAGFILANSLRAGRVPFRRPVFPVLDASFLPELRSTLSSWAVPGSFRIEMFSGQNAFLSAAVAVALLAIMAGMIVVAYRNRKAACPDGKAPGIPFLFALFALVYWVVLMCAEVFVDGLLRPDLRLLSPMFAPLLIAAAFLFWRWLGSIPRGGMRRAVTVVLVVYTLFYAGCGIYWMSICRRNGRGYNSRAYQAPEVVQALNEVRALGAVPIFTNDCGAVYFQAGRYAYSFPSEVGTKNPAALAKALGTAPACFVYYWTPPHLAAVEGNMDRDRFEKSLIETLALRILVRSETITVLGRPASN